MSLRKRGVWIVGGAVLAVVLAVVGYIISGSSAIESWVGSQVLEIGGTYLEPTLQFERLTYVRPRTILLDKLTLSSPDPAKPGHSVVILAVKRARLELTEIPRRGQPIRFSKVILESPEIRAIAATPGGARLVGFSHLLKASTDTRPAEGTAKPAEGAKPGPMKLSDWLQIRHVEIVDGKISYDSRMPDTPPISLDAINAGLDFTPASGSPQPGLYAIASTISRQPAFDLHLQGQINIDTLTVELAKFAVSLDLQEKNVHVLPAELQEILKSAEVAGQLHLSAAGTLPLTNYRQCTLESKGELTAARVAAGQNRLSIDNWTWEVGIAGGVATIRRSDAQLLGGELHLTGTIPLDDTQPAQLELKADKLQIQKLLRSSNPGELPLYAGNVAAQGTFSAPLATWNKQAGGGGTFTLRQGRIDNLPVLGPIVASLNNFLSKTLGGNKPGSTDTAEGSFSFAGNCVRLDHFAATAGALALRGEGTIGFDRRLDLRLNAGPMERLQNALGDLGKAWASASDAMAGYRVTGTLSDPQVSMELGGGP